MRAKWAVIGAPPCHYTPEWDGLHKKLFDSAWLDTHQVQVDMTVSAGSLICGSISI